MSRFTILFFLFSSLSLVGASKWFYYEHFPWVYDNVSKDWLYLSYQNGKYYAFHLKLNSWQEFNPSEHKEDEEDDEEESSSYDNLPVIDEGNCFIITTDRTDPEEFSVSTGKKVVFCCGSCKKAFDGAPAYFLKLIPELGKYYTTEEKQKIGVDKVKLLEQRYCPIYPARRINPLSKTVEYNGKTIYLWSSAAQRRWKRDPDTYFKEAFDKGLLPQFQ